MSAPKVQRKQAYQQIVDEVLAALSTDPRLDMNEAEHRSALRTQAEEFAAEHRGLRADPDHLP